MEFTRSDPSVVRSIRQRYLLNTWLRAATRHRPLPVLHDFQPDRVADELADMMGFDVVGQGDDARFLITQEGARLTLTYGNTGKGRYLDEYLGARLAPIVMPVYYECIARRLPAYTISNIDDIYGRIVAYERLLLPFSESDGVTHIIASLKTISEDGGFEIRNLMRGSDQLPVPKLRTIIDRELFHRVPGRIPVGDVLEFD